MASNGDANNHFDENLLNEVVTRYAKVNVSGVNYYILDGNNDYGTPSGSMHDNLWISADATFAPIANNFVFERYDSNQIFAEIIGGDGTRKQVSFGIPFGSYYTYGDKLSYVFAKDGVYTIWSGCRRSNLAKKITAAPENKMVIALILPNINDMFHGLL